MSHGPHHGSKDNEERINTRNLILQQFTSNQDYLVPVGDMSIPMPTQLLDMIADAEHNLEDDYNTGYGNVSVPFTSMTINEVLEWQDNYVADGSISSAAGRYQVLRGTLRDMVNWLDLSGDELFDEAMQDRIAVALLERRQYDDFLRGDITDEEFMLNLSMEWASLPSDMDGFSYYDGDGINSAQTTPEIALAAINAARLDTLVAASSIETFDVVPTVSPVPAEITPHDDTDDSSTITISALMTAAFSNDYNKVHGNQDVDLTAMTIHDVMRWQIGNEHAGSPNSDVGRYQISPDMLIYLRDSMRLTGEELFDEAMQDRMNIAMNALNHSNNRDNQALASIFNTPKQTDQTPIMASNVNAAPEQTTGELLNLIGFHQSGDDYNAVYGDQAVDLTAMTVHDVMRWQIGNEHSGSPSSAVGRYKIEPPTLIALRDELRLTGNELFDQAMQDRMALALLEKRGLNEYLSGYLDNTEFMSNLAEEWAALPVNMNGDSHYAGEATVAPDQLFAALETTQNDYMAMITQGYDTQMALAASTISVASEFDGSAIGEPNISSRGDFAFASFEFQQPEALPQNVDRTVTAKVDDHIWGMARPASMSMTA